MQGSSPASTDMPANKYVSNESMQSYSGVSSTNSIEYDDSLVGQLGLLELEGEWMQCLDYQQTSFQIISNICCFQSVPVSVYTKQ
jgi:hypothetical protein